MIKHITYLELLQMIKEDTQPQSIQAIDNFSFDWDPSEGSYICNEAEFGGTLLNVWLTQRYSDFTLARSNIISYLVPLLTIEEREYLEAVILPFRDRLKELNVSKSKLTNSEYINLLVYLPPSHTCELHSLPGMPVDKYFKGLERGHSYAPEELGL